MLTRILHRAISAVVNKPLSHWAPLVPPFIFSVLIDELANLERFNSWFIAILSLAASTILAVTTHRLILLGSNHVPKYGFRGWGRRETLFFAYMAIVQIAIFAVTMIPLILVILVSASLDLSSDILFWFFLVATIVAALYVSSRFCLVLPATAIDHPLFMSGAWSQSRNHQGTVFLIFGVIPLSLAAPAMLLYLVDSQLLEILSGLLVSVGVVIGIVLLSIAYDEIVVKENV